MQVLFIKLTPGGKIEEGARYFVKDSKEAALLLYGAKNSTPNPDAVTCKLYNIDIEAKNITEMSVPKVIFAVD